MVERCCGPDAAVLEYLFQRGRHKERVHIATLLE
jgi:hypothetical protein